MGKVFARLFTWFAKYAELNVGICIGVALGVLLSLPFGVRFPDTITTLIGSVAGSVGTVGSAIWLWKLQDKKDSTQIAKSIGTQSRPVYEEMDAFSALMRVRANEIEVINAARHVREEIHKCNTRIGRFTSSIVTLEPKQQIAIIDLEDLLEKVDLHMNEFQTGWMEPNVDRNAVAVVNDDNKNLLKGYVDDINPGETDDWDRPKEGA